MIKHCHSLFYYFSIMKHIFACLLFCLLCLCTEAQQLLRNDLRKHTVLFYGGLSIHGSGDLPGFSYGFTYEHMFGSNWIWSLSFDSNLNDGEQLPFIYEDQRGNIINSTLHDVNAGFQLTYGIGYRLIHKPKHRFALHPGIFVRYQASSLNDVMEIIYPELTGFPIPIRIIENYNDNSTWAIGGMMRFQYDYLIKTKYLLGLQLAWQTDTNGDAISNLSLRFGYTF